MSHPFTRDEVLAFVAELTPEAQQLYRLADEIVLITDDTLSDEFQIAATVLDLFAERLAQRKGVNFPP